MYSRVKAELFSNEPYHLVPKKYYKKTNKLGKKNKCSLNSSFNFTNISSFTNR